MESTIMSMSNLKKSRAMKECERARIPNFVLETIVFLAIFILFQISAPFLMQLFIPLMRQAKDEAGLYVIQTAITNMMFLVIIIVPLLYCLFIEKRSIAGMGFYGNVGKSAVAGIAAGLGLTVLVAGSQILLGAGVIEWSGTLSVPVCIVFFLTTLIQSSGEEVLCRGFFMNSLGSRHSWVFAAVVNSVIFGAIHMGNPGVTPLAIINVVVAGILFSVIAIRYNLWVSCAAHAMWNFSEGYIFGSNISGNEAMMSVFSVTPTDKPTWLTGGEFGIEGSIVVFILYILAIALVLFLPRSSKRQEA